MSSILEELKRKRAEEGKSYLDISTENDYSSVEKADKERQEQLKTLEEAVAKFRTPYIDYKENPNTIQSIPLEDESFSRPAGDTMQSNQGNNPSKLGPNPITGLGRLANTAETAKDVVVGDVANQLANIKVGIAASPVFQTAKIDANQLLDYANGNHNIVNSLAVKRLENSEPAKTIAPVAVMLDEIKKGTYKGTAEDIQKTLKYGDDTSYAKWYNQKIANLEGGFLNIHNPQDMMKANQQMYGNTAGNIMNTVASGGAKIGEFITNASLLGPVYAGAMSGLSRDSSQNVEQIRNEGLDQVARDIGVDVSLGALFSYLMGEATGAINSAIQNAIPKSVLSKAGIIAKNVVSGAGGAYASVGTTGTLRNIYNKLQGREVSQEEAIHPWWSVDTGIATFMGALFNGINGTKSDLAKAEQIKAVMNKQGELNAKLTAYSKDIAKQFEAANQQGVVESYNNGRQAIEDFFKRNNLGKVTNTLKNEYLKQWFEYNYDLGIKYENLTNPSATNTTPRIGPSLPTVARPTQQATVVPPPSTYTPSTPLATVPQTQSNAAITPSATQGTVLTKENYSDVLKAITPILDEKEIEEEVLRLIQDYDIDLLTDRTLDKIQRQAEKNVFDKFAQTEEGKKLIADYVEPPKAIKNGLRIGEDRLNYLIHENTTYPNEYHKDYGKAFLTRMTPEEFLNLTSTEKFRKNYLEPQTEPLDIDKLKNQNQSIYLSIDFNDDKTVGKVGGHEGRHRALALLREGYNGPMDVVVYPYESTYDKYNAKNIGKFILRPQVEGGKDVVVDYLDAITSNNIDYLREKYLNTNDKTSVIYAPKSKLPIEKLPIDWNNVSKKDFKDYVTQKLSDFSNSIDKIYLSKENKHGQWGVYVKGKEKTIRSGNKVYEDNYDTYIPFEKGISPDDMLETVKAELEQWYPKKENSTQGSFSTPKNLPEELPKSKRKFLKDLKAVGYINVNGIKINSVEDMADVAQAFRDPTVETMRAIFQKDGKIIMQSACSAGDPTKVPIGGKEFYGFCENIKTIIKQTGADSFWVTHNHPNGRAVASGGDKAWTKALIPKLNSTAKFLGHIIINHNEYAFISPEGKTKNNIKLKEKTYNEIENNFSKEAWANTRIWDANDDQWEDVVQRIATIASLVKNSPDISTMILVSRPGDVRVIQSLPNKFFENTTEKIRAYAKETALKNGADDVLYATTNPDTYSKMVKRVGSAISIVLYEPSEDGSLKILRSTSVGGNLYKLRGPAKEISPSVEEQLNGPQTTLEELKKQFAPKEVEKKEPPKKLEPKKREEKPAKEEKQPVKRLEKKKPVEKKEPIKKLEKKQPEPDKRLGFDAIDKDKEALEKANDKLRDELAKQKKEYEERLKKKDEALEKFKQTKKEQKEKQKLKLKKKEEQKKEEQRFKSATPKGKLRMLGRKIEKQTGYYEISDYPELDEKYEKEFGSTIRQTIKTLKARDVFPYLPSKVQDIVNTFADETYLKANWKTFDKYVKEALQIKELKDLVDKSDTPVAKRLLSVMQEHKTAPITIKNAKEMYDDLQILADIVELAQERLDYRRQPENWEKILDKSAEALEELEKTNTPKKLTPKSAKLEKNFDNFKKLPETFQTLKTRIQAAFGGNPNSPLKIIWDWFEEGREREAMLDSKFAENFDGLVEKTAGGWKFAGELEEDFADDAPYVDTGITGTNPKTGKPYEENAKLPKDIIMHIVASSRNDDNLMSFCKILLGTDYKGNPVYSNPGGYIVPNEYYMKRGKIGEAYEKGKKYVFTKKDIEHLEGMLTETEKKFVEAALRVGGITAQYGNEVSQKLIGRDLFSVIKNYIRIIRDLSTFDGELIDPARLDNLANATSDKYVGIGGILGRGGSLEGRNHRSTRPIYGESLKQSVEKSFGGAKKYIAYALPLYDTDYILEGRLPDKFEQVEVVDKEPKSTPSLKYVKVDEPPRNGADRTMYYVDNGDSYTIYKVAEKGKTMRQLLTNAGEEGFYDYYKQFVDGLVGRNKKYSKFASTRARVVLNANLRVAATQFFSYFQMGQFLNHPTSSMTKALADKGTIFKLAKDFLESKDVDTSKLKGQRLVNRFLEYVTYTNTQRGLGKFSDDVRYVEAGSTVLGRINAGKLLATVDKFTVDATFRALMYDIMADGTKFGSEEFFKQFKNRLYSIYQSNPQYSAIYRTPLQNKGTAISTALSQFQTVMLQGFNNASQAAMAHEYYKRQGNESEKKKWGKIFKRTVSGLIISGLTLAALKDYLDQLAGKEKDEPYVKRITMSFIQNMLSYTIVGDEIFSALFKFNNYDLTTNELSYFNTALDAIGDMGTLVTKPTPPNAIKLIKSLGQTLGLPTGSIENTFGILSNLTPGNAFKAYSVMKDNSKYEKWLKNQDAIGTDFKTFYEISQAVKEKTLAEKYGYVKGSETGTYGSLSYAKGRAIMDVLGIEQGKKMTKEQKQAYTKWYNIFKN